MTTQGDITDTFDDADDLVRSVEEGTKGPWNDETSKFVDPNVARLQDELKKPEVRDYHQRRMLELQQRMMDKAKPAKTENSGVNWGEPDLGEWSESNVGAQQPTAAPKATAADAESNPTGKTQLIGVKPTTDNATDSGSKKMPAAVWIALGCALLAGTAYVLLMA